MSDEVTLRVNGLEYGGWLEVEITAGIERQSRSFSLSITRTWPGAKELPRRVKPFDLCEVFIGSEKVLTGFIDATPIRYDSKSIAVAVRGRSKTADLVDCSAKFATGQWRNRRLESIVSDLSKTYNLNVRSEVDTGSTVIEHQIEPGETGFESIDRLLTARQLLCTDDAEGRLVLIEPGSSGRASTALVHGGNILSADAPLDYKDVFSEYKCVGQRSGNDFDSGATVSGISATAQDTTVPRYRLLLIMQSGQVTLQDCSDRVAYERLYRAAKALETTYVVQGWRQRDGTLWKENQLVRVTDPVIGFNDELLISEVTYRIGKGGTTCALTVIPAAAYAARKQQKAKAAKKTKGGSGGSWADVQPAD